VNSLDKAFQADEDWSSAEEFSAPADRLAQAQGQMDYAKSQLDATVIRAPVTGTILERTAEKGELITAQFASAAEGGPRGSVVAGGS
jgi:HlyD family secretion protein